MRSLFILVLCAVCTTYFNSNAYAMLLLNSVKEPIVFNPILDLDCDYNPDTDEISNCKVVVNTNE